MLHKTVTIRPDQNEWLEENRDWNLSSAVRDMIDEVISEELANSAEAKAAEQMEYNRKIAADAKEKFLREHPNLDASLLP